MSKYTSGLLIAIGVAACTLAPKNLDPSKISDSTKTEYNVLPSDKILARYRIPDSVSNVDISYIVRALEKGEPVGNGTYLSQFIDIVEFSHESLTGNTHNRQMLTGLAANNPDASKTRIEIIVSNGNLGISHFAFISRIRPDLLPNNEPPFCGCLRNCDTLI